MDNFDKLDSEFADKGPRAGFKYWFCMCLAYFLAIVGLVAGIIACLPGKNIYLSLLTLLCGLFGCQSVFWAKGTQKFTQPLKICFIFNLVVVVFACVVLYIVPLFR